MAACTIRFRLASCNPLTAFNFLRCPIPVTIYCVMNLSSGPPLNQTKPPLGLCICRNFSYALLSSPLTFTRSKSNAIFFFCCASLFACSTHGVSSSNTAFNSWFFSRLLKSAAVSSVLHVSNTCLIFGELLPINVARLLA